MLSTAKDLRAIARGRTLEERDIGYILESLNKDLLDHARAGKSNCTYMINADASRVSTVREEIMKRLATGGFSVSVATKGVAIAFDISWK